LTAAPLTGPALAHPNPFGSETCWESEPYRQPKLPLPHATLAEVFAYAARSTKDRDQVAQMGDVVVAQVGSGQYEFAYRLVQGPDH
jgi:hypothetical protein